MRTTITLDDDVYRKISQKLKETGKSAKELYNELLRQALTAGKPPKSNKPVRLPVFTGKGGLLPGFSWNMSFAQTLDRLDELDWQAKK